jgi:tetratricopeptide (TPR) repeat protein
MGRSVLVLGLLALAGCRDGFVLTTVQKPVVTDTAAVKATDERVRLAGILARLEGEEQELGNVLRTLAGRRAESQMRLRDAVGSDYGNLIQANAVDWSLYLSRPDVANTAVPVYAEELCRHRVHCEQVDKRIRVIDLALAESHAWLELSGDYKRFHGVDLQNPLLLVKLEAIAEDKILAPDTPSPDDVAQALKAAFRPAREVAELRRRTAEVSEREATERLAAQRKAEELAAQREAEKDAARREAERQALLRAAEFAAASAAQQDQVHTLARQRADALKLYGGAYHDFFDGKYEKALASLDQAIDLDPADPRYRFYRGLVRLRLGQSEDAVVDFRRGGELERQGAFGVGAAMERIQGRERLMIEEYRP